MKRLVWTFGLIAGAIDALWLIAFALTWQGCPDFTGNEIVGYTAMVISFSMIFVAIRQFRDKFNGGVITFGKAFRIGLFISLIASTIYVLVWLFEYFFFIPDFGDTYAQHMIDKMRDSGASEAELTAKMQEMSSFNEMYKNPIITALITYTEILPVGLLVSLICALILKRKKDPVDSVTT